MSQRAEKSISTSQITVFILSEEMAQELERKFPVSLSTAEKLQGILEEVCTNGKLQASIQNRLQALERAKTASR